MLLIDYFFLYETNKLSLTNNFKTNKKMKTPTLEEVKEYFKNAKEVRCLWDDKVYDISDWKLYEDVSGFRFAESENSTMNEYCGVFGVKDYAKFAEIISYKDTYTVSKDFILEAHESACSTCKTKIENQFPELFPKAELEVGKWYKANTYKPSLFYVIGIKGTDAKGYGFEDGIWINNQERYYWDFEKVEPATKEEVETALIAELKKKYKGKNVKCLHLQTKILFDNIIDFRFGDDGCLRCDTQNRCICIFDNGKWAEIISEPIELSLDEIAEKFNVDVSLIKIKK